MTLACHIKTSLLISNMEKGTGSQLAGVGCYAWYHFGVDDGMKLLIEW